MTVTLSPMYLIMGKYSARDVRILGKMELRKVLSSGTFRKLFQYKIIKGFFASKGYVILNYLVIVLLPTTLNKDDWPLMSTRCIHIRSINSHNQVIIQCLMVSRDGDNIQVGLMF